MEQSKIIDTTKTYHYPEKYYDDIMKGAHLVADECTKDKILE